MSGLSFQTPGYEDMELSTQLLIAEALKRGYQVEVLDRQDNFIRISNGIKTEYVRKANQTSLDRYITHFVLDNKKVLKQILEEKGIKVPKGKSYTELAAAQGDWGFWKGKKMVIKPRSTNFGTAVAILEETFTETDFKKALSEAFAEDETVLAEEFVEGKEYRFLVIAELCVAVLHRIPANVVGDGSSSITELVNKKNAHPYRGKGYKTPLEKIELGEFEKDFLQKQDLNIDSIPTKNQQVFLRANSNISTGGDSLDQTDEMPQEFKDLAVQAAEAAHAVIAGVDMIIGQDHAILEINWNPVLYFHDFPFEGKNRNTAKYILDALFI